MIELEARLAAQYPEWFQGPRARLARPLLRGFGRLSRLDRINAFLASHGHLRGHGFVEAALAFLQLRYCVDQVERERIPQSGATVIVANHPSGALDALALLHLVGGVRRDVRIVANDVLCAIEPLADLLLPLRVLGGAPSTSSVAAVSDALARGECVIVFPAGEVSRLGLGGIRDGRWRRGFVRFAREAGAAVVPVRVQARNSALFYGASALYRPAGMTLLAREMFAARGRRMQLRVGLPLTLAEDSGTASAVTAVRQALHAIGTRRENTNGMRPLAHAVDRRLLVDALAQLPVLGHTPDGKRIHAGGLDADSPLLCEIGRLREQCFRAVGEGTGQRLDIDRFDTWYDHIVLWDPATLQVAGAYRVAPGAQVLEQRGLAGLYSASLFHYADAQLPRLAQGMELGRSFVAPGYQGTRSLDDLWLGIGAYLRLQPQVRYLFGPVTISAHLPLPAREQLVAYYQHFYAASDGTAGATAMRPFGFQSPAPDFGELDADTAFRVLKANLGALGARVPTLYKQYTELCEPGGVRFLAFSVDPDFNHAVDGLIELDLARIRPRKRQRYIDAPTVVRKQVAA